MRKNWTCVALFALLACEVETTEQPNEIEAKPYRVVDHHPATRLLRVGESFIVQATVLDPDGNPVEASRFEWNTGNSTLLSERYVGDGVVEGTFVADSPVDAFIELIAYPCVTGESCPRNQQESLTFAAWIEGQTEAIRTFAETISLRVGERRPWFAQSVDGAESRTLEAITYASGDTNLFTVSGHVLEGIAAGTTMLTLKSGDIEREITVEVTPEALSPSPEEGAYTVAIGTGSKHPSLWGKLALNTAGRPATVFKTAGPHPALIAAWWTGGGFAFDSVNQDVPRDADLFRIVIDDSDTPWVLWRSQILSASVLSSPNAEGEWISQKIPTWHPSLDDNAFFQSRRDADDILGHDLRILDGIPTVATASLAYEGSAANAELSCTAVLRVHSLNESNLSTQEIDSDTDCITSERLAGVTSLQLVRSQAEDIIVLQHQPGPSTTPSISGYRKAGATWGAGEIWIDPQDYNGASSAYFPPHETYPVTDGRGHNATGIFWSAQSIGTAPMRPFFEPFDALPQTEKSKWTPGILIAPATQETRPYAALSGTEMWIGLNAARGLFRLDTNGATQRESLGALAFENRATVSQEPYLGHAYGIAGQANRLHMVFQENLDGPLRYVVGNLRRVSTDPQNETGYRVQSRSPQSVAEQLVRTEAGEILVPLRINNTSGYIPSPSDANSDADPQVLVAPNSQSGFSSDADRISRPWVFYHDDDKILLSSGASTPRIFESTDGGSTFDLLENSTAGYVIAHVEQDNGKSIVLSAQGLQANPRVYEMNPSPAIPTFTALPTTEGDFESTLSDADDFFHPVEDFGLLRSGNVVEALAFGRVAGDLVIATASYNDTVYQNTDVSAEFAAGFKPAPGEVIRLDDGTKVLTALRAIGPFHEALFLRSSDNFQTYTEVALPFGNAFAKRPLQLIELANGDLLVAGSSLVDADHVWAQMATSSDGGLTWSSAENLRPNGGAYQVVVDLQLEGGDVLVLFGDNESFSFRDHEHEGQFFCCDGDFSYPRPAEFVWGLTKVSP